MHNKKEKGDLGVAQTIAELVSQGWRPCVPLSEHQSYDLIAEKNGKMLRVQVRYTSPRDEILPIKLASCWSDKHGAHVQKRKQEDFEVLAIYKKKKKKCYFILSSVFTNERQINLRLSPSKNNQKLRVRMADDYLILN